MNQQEEAAMRAAMARQSTNLATKAQQDPRGSAAPAGRPSGYNTSSPGAPRPQVSAPLEPSQPLRGGATDDPNMKIEVGPDGVVHRTPRAATPGPGADASGVMDTFGSMLTPKGRALIDTVRASRASRQAEAQAQQTPTFGDVAQQTRDQQAQAAAAPPAPQAPTPEQVASIQQQLKFVVDTRSGHFTPVLPGGEDPNLKRHDIMVSMGPDGAPNVLGQGKGVTSASLSRLADPKRHPLKPQLNPNFKLPAQYAQLGASLGIPTEGDKA